MDLDITPNKRWSNKKISLQQLNEFYICIDWAFPAFLLYTVVFPRIHGMNS